jgi:hypothetical protein
MPEDNSEIWRSKLEAHRRKGKELIPPFQQHGIVTTQIYWWRDHLPEFLWIDSVVERYGHLTAVRLFNEFLSAADRFNSDEKDILDGTVGSFTLVPENRREEFRRELATYIAVAVDRPFGEILSLYPDCPMSWVLTNRPADRDKGVKLIRNAVNRLSHGKDEHGGFCRTFPLHRMFAHKKIYITDTMTELATAIQEYPAGDRWRVETFARSTHDGMFLQRAAEDPGLLIWSRSFWNTNLTIAPCHYE